ncbi:myo-inosose-2 dehydratase [Aureibacter tunicatorum]|uniref:Inosose dehydratase n=1 Tax=Aureibacter tunicatorum TaxID=866807 RepID=A0AAE3XNY8_9BACT|nr:myo-inosose-2 dehydratase [Aureibacter tunicatorum]MDR6239384.1 inosose dehydratase [Aureibacter tunicatorum]BDD04693.1 myo-inosose-2 dehydratase [Aureibacter tunicatorum]
MISNFNKDKVFIGITPTSWWNDDFLDIDIGIPFEQCVSEMALAGYEGCSIGHKYPKDIDTLKKELSRRNLSVSEPWTSTYFTVNEMYEKTIEDFKKSMQLIKTMGGKDVVIAELGHSAHQRDIALKANRPIFNDQQWKSLIDGLHVLGQMATDEGMNLCYHHHMGTGVQTREQVDKLMNDTDPNLVHLLFDTGHITFSETNENAALDLAKAYGNRIKHVHLKNIRRPAMELSDNNNFSFKESILNGIFTVPGDQEGMIDFEPIFQALADSGFEGWLIVEAEQDPSKAYPLDYAKMGREYIKQVTGI